MVDKYLVDGCMRCKYGGTPKCKVLNWVGELKLLRTLVLSAGLSEEIKWGMPVYTYNGKNIVTINALKASANIGFFKGVLLKDEHKLLQQQGNIQSSRIIRFTEIKQIVEVKDKLLAYINEAIQLEISGKKITYKKNPEPIPEELTNAFKQDSAFKKAFYSLTPGRQRGYIIYFSQPKQSLTRIGRIEKLKSRILDGLAMNDK
ncbi:MAG: YdeI/OmpD-associated family protein [Chitinophagaceae bacterium]